MWKRYRFNTYSVEDYRPLVFNPKYPWWCSGFGGDDDTSYATIIAYLPKDEDLYKYWDDAFDVSCSVEDKIEFTSRFPKPSYFEEEQEDKEIPINIWDDYYEDGYVPEGEVQETYVYVEDYEILVEDTERYLNFLLEFIKSKLKFNEVEMYLEFYDSRKKYPDINEKDNPNFHYSRWEIVMKNITHKRREELVKLLMEANLEFEGHKFRIYSES